MNKLSAFLFAAIFSTVTGLTCASAAYAEFKIATVDVNRILNETTEGKAKRATFDDASAKAKKKVEERRQGLEVREAKLKAGKVKADSPEAQAFNSDARDFARFVKDTETELRDQFLKSNKELTKKALALVKDYAKEHDVDLVLEKSGGLGGSVLYGSNTSDITETIIQQMNAK